MNGMEDLKNGIREMLVRDLRLQGITPDDIDPSAPLFGDGLGLDSLDAVELVVLVQKNFNVQIADMDEGKIAFESVNALADFIARRRDKGG